MLDTHVVLWALSDDARLGASAREMIVSAAGNVIVSVASVWEASIKQSIGKLSAPLSLWSQAEADGYRLADITRADAEAVRDLPFHHRDPFDRLILAHAARLEARVVTADPAFMRYDVDVIRADH